MGVPLNVEFGAMTPPLAEQLADFKALPKDEVERLNSLADCITSLHVNSLITESQSDMARKKLGKTIIKLVEKHYKKVS